MSRFLSRLISLGRNLTRKSRIDSDLDEEIRAQVELMAEEKMREGMNAEEARRAAKIELGGVEQVKEQVRAVRTGAWLDSLLQDVRFALRMLRKSPGFTAVAVLTLALGIGANTAIFSLIDAVILKMLPVQHAEQLFQLEVNLHNEYGMGTSFSYPAYQRLRHSNETFSGLLTVSNIELHTTAAGQSEQAVGQYVSGNLFSVLGVRPLLGRTILPMDDNPSSGGNPSVAVIGYALWMGRFGGDRSAIGKQIEIEGSPFTIVGVAPPGFFGLQVGSPQDFWVPISAEPLFHTSSWLPRYNYHWLSVVGRLKPSVDAARAASNIAVVFNRYLLETAPGIRDAHDRNGYLAQTAQLAPAGNGLSRLRREFSRPLLILMVLVSLVLLVACANVASLLLARAASRRRELAVRLALGATRWRLMRQALVESLLLSSLGGLAGLLIAFFASSYLVNFMSSTPVPVVLNVRPDLRILSFTLLASLIAGVVFGLAPALRATHVDAGPDLKERVSAGGRHSSRLGKLLVVSQVALSLLLLIGAGLFVGTLHNLKTFDAGFVADNVLLTSVNPGKAGYKGAQLMSFYRQLLDRMRAHPGVVSASLSMVTPVAGGGVDLSVSVEGYVPRSDEDNVVYVNRISPGYLETVRTPLLLGRDFSAAIDTPDSPKAALINETASRYYFHGASPLGRHVTMDGPAGSETFEIVGVVKDSKYMTLREPTHRTIYTDCFQVPAMAGDLDLELRGARNPLSLAPFVRSAVRSLSNTVALTDFSTLTEQVDRSITQERLVATLSGFFGGLALLLACVGLYGLMSYRVGNRTNEIGIRMALGAARANVVWMILGESLRLAALGIVIGIPVAVAASRLLESQISGLLFGVSATSRETIGAACIALIVSAAIATCVPAWRASRVDPMVALRHE